MSSQPGRWMLTPYRSVPSWRWRPPQPLAMVRRMALPLLAGLVAVVITAMLRG
jgi:hypothetical protein